MSSTCYVVSTLDTRTLKIREVGFYSESAMTLTYTGEGDYCYLDVFHVSGLDFEDACRWAARQIKNDDLLEWVRPFVRSRVRGLEPL